MQITYIARKITLPESFTKKAELKLHKLDKFFDDDAAAEVKVSSQKDTATVELTIRADGLIFRAENADSDKLDALDAAVDTIIRRIRRNKTKLQKKIKASAFEPADLLPPEEELPPESVSSSTSLKWNMASSNPNPAPM